MTIVVQTLAQQAIASVGLPCNQERELSAGKRNSGRGIEEGEGIVEQEDDKMEEEDISVDKPQISGRAFPKRALRRVDSFKSILNLNQSLISKESGPSLVRRITPNFIGPITRSRRRSEAHT